MLASTISLSPPAADHEHDDVVFEAAPPEIVDSGSEVIDDTVSNFDESDGAEQDEKFDDGNLEDEIENWIADASTKARLPPRKRLRITRNTQVPKELGLPSQKLGIAAASRGIPSASFKRMVLAGLPMAMLDAMVFLESMFPCSESMSTKVTELFSGVESVAGGFRDAQQPASVFDILRHALHEDIMSSEGFLTALRLVRDTEPGGLVHVAQVCSTWVYLCRASTGRSRSNPLGDLSSPLVVDANSMCSRVALLCVYAMCLSLLVLH